MLDAVEHGALDLGGLVEATGLPRATAHRLAVALEAHGLVRRDDRGQFVPGLRLVALGRAASRTLALPDVARPTLESLRADTGESVQLYVRDGHTRVCVASLESPHGLRTIVALGASLPWRSARRDGSSVVKRRRPVPPGPRASASAKRGWPRSAHRSVTIAIRWSPR